MPAPENVGTVEAVIKELAPTPALAQVKQIRWKFPPDYLNAFELHQIRSPARRIDSLPGRFTEPAADAVSIRWSAWAYR